MLPSEEAALIAEAQGGRTEAFEELVRRYDRSVLRLALNLTWSEENARDIYQESFLRIFRALPNFRFECTFGTWVHRVVTSVCLDHLRRSAARPREEAGDDGESGVGPLQLVADTRPDHDPERALARTEMRRRIDRALSRLAHRERLVFELRHDQGMRTAAIAEILETTEETVRNCLYRAHRALRSALSDLREVTRSRPRGEVGPARADTY